MHKVKGFTLIECLVTLAILVSLTAIAVPSLTEFIIKLRVDNEISSLYRLLLTARNAAINSGSTATLCPLENNICSENWQDDISVFIDNNNNQQLDNQEKIIATKSAIDTADKLLYGKSRKAITYAHTGYLAKWGQNGTFRYCPKNHANKARGVIVAVSGRLYKTFNVENGKQDKSRSNKYIICH